MLNFKSDKEQKIRLSISPMIVLDEIPMIHTIPKSDQNINNVSTRKRFISQPSLPSKYS